MDTNRRSERQQPAMTRRLETLKRNIAENLRNNPGKCAGIAAGAGLGLGLLARRLRRRRDMPDYILIEAC